MLFYIYLSSLSSGRSGRGRSNSTSSKVLLLMTVSNQELFWVSEVVVLDISRSDRVTIVGDSSEGCRMPPFGV